MWRALGRGIHRLFQAGFLFVVCTVVVPVLVGAVVLATFIFVPLPATLPEPKPIEASQPSIVLDSQGNQIAIFREFEQRTPVRRDQIPVHLKQAVIAAEDARFYSHNGVDVRGATRALVRDLQGGGGPLQGGSTITQQYVKLTYTGKQRTIVRKVKEAVLASQLDRDIDKEEILHRYLDAIFLGDGATGVGAASRVYFRKDVSQLTVSEAATLAGVIPAPSRYSPRGNLEAAEGKRRIVLQKMLEQGYLTPEQHAAALASVLVASPTPKDPATATVVYPREQVQTRYPYFVDYVRRYLVDKYGEERLLTGGLVIQTTLDPDLQAKAEASVANALKGTRPGGKKKNGDPNILNMTLVAVEPGTGRVKALVGGRDPNDPYIGAVNIALGRCPTLRGDPRKVEVKATCWDRPAPVQGGGSGNQPGSTFKAFTLAAALEKGIQPTRVISGASPYVACRGSSAACAPIHNAGDTVGGGSMTLAAATSGSVNTVFARLAAEIGNKSVAEMAKKLGMDQVWESPAVHGASYTLGTLDVSSLEMAAAYGVFANRGVRVKATPIVKIVDQAGNVLEDNLQPKGERVLEEPVADTMNQMLQGPLINGTARGKGLDRPAAGKTGSTNDNVDAWFVGYTPDLATAVSIGYDEGKPMIGIKGYSRIFGGTIPADTWRAFMLEAHRGVPVTQFTEPAPIRKVDDRVETVRRAQREGIDPGARRDVTGTELGGPYEVAPGRPRVPVPPPPPTRPTPTTTPDDPTVTTTTTRGPIITVPGRGGGDATDPDGGSTEPGGAGP